MINIPIFLPMPYTGNLVQGSFFFFFLISPLDIFSMSCVKMLQIPVLVQHSISSDKLLESQGHTIIWKKRQHLGLSLLSNESSL